jgi:hypothetical protein
MSYFLKYVEFHNIQQYLDNGWMVLSYASPYSVIMKSCDCYNENAKS